jgi:hypothetical protein
MPAFLFAGALIFISKKEARGSVRRFPGRNRLKSHLTYPSLGSVKYKTA